MTLRGARDDPKAWPPSSAPLRLVVPAPRPRLLQVASPEPRPPFIRPRERVSDFFGSSAATEALAALLRDLGLALRLLQQIVLRRTGTVPVGQILARKRGLPFLRCRTRLRLRARHVSPLRRPRNAVCCSEPRSSLRRSALRPNPLRRTRRPATPQTF